VVAHPTVTEVLAACGQAEDALEKHTLETLMRIDAKTYNQGTQLVPVSHEMYVAQTPLTSDVC
jgi:inorganic pyrophosphatase/exopolyphosphatase